MTAIPWMWRLPSEPVICLNDTVSVRETGDSYANGMTSRAAISTGNGKDRVNIDAAVGSAKE